MAPRRETFLASPNRCRCLAAGTVLLGVLLCAEYARPARAGAHGGAPAQDKTAGNGCWSEWPGPLPEPTPRPVREDPEPTAKDREARGDALADLHDAVADLGSGDALTRERAQEAIINLGDTFADDVAVRIATAKNLEVKTRLLEVLETWRRAAYRKTAGNRDAGFEYWRPYAESAELARSGGTPLPMYTSSGGGTSSGGPYFGQ